MWQPLAGAGNAARAVNVANGSLHEWWPATSSMATIPLHDNGESPDLLQRCSVYMTNPNRLDLGCLLSGSNLLP